MVDYSLREELARTMRVAHYLGLVGLLGHASVRLPDSRGILVTPGHASGSPPPNRLSEVDLITVEMDGRTVEGSYRPPIDLDMHLSIYRARPDVGAMIHSHQPEMVAFGIVDRPLLPLVHQSAELVQSPLPRFSQGELIRTMAQGDALARALDQRAACQLPGHGLVVVGSSLVEALTRADRLEGLARMNRLAASIGELKTVSAEQGDRIVSQRASMEDFRDYYKTLDPGVGGQPTRKPSSESVKGVKELVIIACRVLARFDLVQHLEHVSHRLPNQDRFVISPRGNMKWLKPQDLAIVDMSGRWVEGPLAPPPFRFLHRDIFLARPDVQAIVHTHELYGRLYPAAGLAVPPIQRTGAIIAMNPLPVYDVPDLIFDEEPRRSVVRLLGQGSIVHERAHGTDFVAPTIEEATAAAIHREYLAELYHRASQLGKWHALPDYVLACLPEEEPSAAQWWDYWMGLLEMN